MKNSIFIFLIISFISCDKKKHEEFYENGNKKLMIEFNDEEMKNGRFYEYYKDGKLERAGKYFNGEVEDSVFTYYKNSKLREKGFFKNGYKNGWHTTFRENGKTLKKEEFITHNTKYLQNQKIFYLQNGEIDFSKSSFFKLNIPDTIKLGKNKLTLNYYDNTTKGDFNYLKVIIENHYSEIEVKNDTFTDGTRNPFFGVYGYKKGELLIKGTIKETILNKTIINKDSASLKITDKYKFFTKKVYVTDK